LIGRDEGDGSADLWLQPGQVATDIGVLGLHVVLTVEEVMEKSADADDNGSRGEDPEKLA